MNLNFGGCLPRPLLSVGAWMMLGAAALLAQQASPQTVSGRVLDPDGLAVAGARVNMVNRTSGELRMTTSSDAGAYNFTGVPNGTYLIEAEAVDASLSGSRDLTVNGSTTVDVTLGLTTSVTEVVVTATGTPISQQEIAKVIDVVDAKQIDERDEYLIIEALRTVPGVQIQTQVGGVMTIKTRGLRNQDTAVLIDGLRFRDATAISGDATSFFSDMNVADLGRAEFLRGSGSSLYGSNAIAGAVSLNSNEGGGPTHGSLRAEGGQLGFLRGVGNLAGGFFNDKLVYSGGFSHLNVVNGVRGKTPNRNTGGQFFSKVNLAPGVSFSGRLWGSDVFQRSVESPITIAENFPATGLGRAILIDEDQIDLVEAGQPHSVGNATIIPTTPDPDGRRQSSFLAGALIFRQELTENTSWRFSYQGVDTNRASWDGPAGMGQFGEPQSSEVSDNDGRTDLIQIRLDSAVGDHQLITAGFELETENLFSIAQRPFGDPETRITSRQVSQSYYAQDQISLADDRLQITVGGRIQHFDLSDPSITGTQSPYEQVQVSSPPNAYTGDVSAAYFIPGSETKLRAHLGNSYRAPSLYERFGSSFFQGFFSFYGDPRLEPERSQAFDAGIDQWFFNSKVRASATFFYTDLSETVVFQFGTPNFENDPFGRPGGYTNSRGGGISRGVELSTQFSPTSKTSVQVGYTYTNADQRTPTIGSDFFQVQGVAAHTFTMTTTQWVTDRMNVTFDFYGTSDYAIQLFDLFGRGIRYDGPKKADLVVNYNLPVSDTRSVDIYGKIENLFDNYYSESGFLAPGAWAIGGFKYNF